MTQARGHAMTPPHIKNVTLLREPEIIDTKSAFHFIPHFVWDLFPGGHISDSKGGCSSCLNIGKNHKIRALTHIEARWPTQMYSFHAS